MESIFNKDNRPDSPSPFSKTWIEKETGHLKKKKSTRSLHQVGYNGGRLFLLLFIVGLILLYILDPIFYSFHKGNAIQAYAYLHNYGGEDTAQALAECGVLSRAEVEKIAASHGDYRGYFNGLSPARREANTIIHYMEQLRWLHHGDYDKLDPLQKLRCVLFIKTGLIPPTSWPVVNPTVPDEGL